MEQDVVLGAVRERVGALVLAGLLAIMAVLSMTILISAQSVPPGSTGDDNLTGMGTSNSGWQNPTSGSQVITLTLAHEANRLEALAASGVLSSTVVDPGTPSDEARDGVPGGAPMTASELAAIRQRLAYDSRPNPPAEAAVGGTDDPSCGDALVYCVYLPIIRRPIPDHYEVYAVDADGTGLVNVSQLGGGDLEPVYSPDGTRIAWLHYAGSNGEIYVANADGSNRINLTNNSRLETSPTWSLDGTRIAFTRYLGPDHPEIFVINSNGTGSLQQLTDGDSGSWPYCRSHSPEWSPTAERIAYVCGLGLFSEVYFMNADGTSKTRLTDDSDDGHREDGALDWSPDGSWIAYTKWNEAHKKADVYKVSIYGSGIVKLTDGPGLNSSPAWSPDGTKIAFHGYLDNQNFEIATISSNDGSGLTNLTKQGAGSGNFWPRWSADGAMISFLSTRDGNLELYVMNSGGTGQTRMTFTKYDENGHDWEPQEP
ncbi:TolB family protein [Chloroflexota bacterium]